jgi:hypothetical protein
MREAAFKCCKFNDMEDGVGEKETCLGSIGLRFGGWASLGRRGQGWRLRKGTDCADCHTPYTDKGLLDESKYLQGAPLIFKPTVQMSWAEAAPPIAGLPLLSEKDAVVFLMTGKLPGGAIPRPPMPQFKLKKTDAGAVVAYLKSLN